jgi:hypothetical protein
VATLHPTADRRASRDTVAMGHGTRPAAGAFDEVRSQTSALSRDMVFIFNWGVTFSSRDWQRIDSMRLHCPTRWRDIRWAACFARATADSPGDRSHSVIE